MVGDSFVDAGDITRAEAKRRTRIRDKKQQLKQRVVDQTPGLDSTQNVRVRRDGNRLVASLTTIGQHNVRDYQVEQQRNARAREQRLAEKLGQESSDNVTGRAQDIDAELTKDASGDISTVQRETARRDIADKVDVDPDRVKIVGQTDDGGFRARIEKQPERTEQFGDIPVENPLTGNRVEDDLENKSAQYRAATDPVIEYITEGAETPISASAMGDPFNPDLVRGNARQVRNFLDPFALAVGAKEAGEFAVTQPNRILMGDGPGFAQDVSERGSLAVSAFTKAANENPADLAGSVLGGAAIGALGGAATSRVTQSAARRVAQADIDAGSARASAFLSDTRGEGQLLRSVDDASPDADSGGLMSDMQDTLDRFERAERTRKAEEAAERLHAERQERLPPGESYEPEGPPEGYRQPAPEGRTVSSGPDTTRSGPTDAQLDAWNPQSPKSSTEVDLTPRESQLAAQMDTPSTDIRDVARQWESSEAAQMRRAAEASSFERRTDLLGRGEATGVALATGEQYARQQQQQYEQAQKRLQSRLGLDTGLGTHLGLDAGISSQSGLDQPTDQPQPVRTDTDTVPDLRVDTQLGDQSEARRLWDSFREFNRPVTDAVSDTRFEPTPNEQPPEYDQPRWWNRQRPPTRNPKRKRDKTPGNQSFESTFAVDVSAWENSWKTGIADIDKLWRERFGGL
ncbi:hypothetical protein C456_04600 [Haloferax volcanii DSM 14919]|nr:hypothetical protein C456_04600 [Haloferax lucentense DSM 14919]